MTLKPLFGLLAALGLAHAAVAADAYPSHPITMVVPTSPGGTTDFTARLLADPLSKALGQAIVIDNRPGAAGNIGTQLVARAKNDGYTLLLQYSGYHVGNPALFKQLTWHPISDFAPVANVISAPQVVAVPASLPVKNLKDLVALAKTRKDKLNFASSGNGSIQHIAGEMLAQIAGAPMVHVPYKGTGPAMTDLLAGTVDMFITTPPPLVGYIANGRLKGLAVTGRKRLDSMPNVPTSAEAGYPSFQVESWFGVLAPAGTPPEIVNRLSAEIKKIADSENFRKQAVEQGAESTYMNPPEFTSFIKGELVKWDKVIKAANISLD
ncbi:MAG: transporter substrate-binding protein [Betaproteobacteria bacterium]|nr:transporter substrate-binding protein [Betaproteobacteria bacterium]